MSERVVDALEVIDIDHRQRHRLIVGGRERRGGAFGEGSAQPETGEFITGRAGGGVGAPFGLGSARDGCRRRTTGRVFAHHVFEERVERRIELPPSVAPHQLHRFGVRQGAFVAAFGRERVVDVGDAHDARHERNVISGQAVRVAGAVPGLVMRSYDRNHIPRELDLGQELHAGDGVLLDEGPLLRR